MEPQTLNGQVTATTTALDIAKYVVHLASKEFGVEIKPNAASDKSGGITHLKLQKILFLTQVHFLVTTGTLLFEDAIEAWPYGPVIPNVYSEYTAYSNKLFNESDKNFAKMPGDASLISDDSKIEIEKVWNAYKGCDAIDLVRFTHEHPPWTNAVNSETRIITPKSITDFYSDFISVN